MNPFIEYAFMGAVALLHAAQVAMFFYTGNRPGALIVTGYTIADVFLIFALLEK